MTTLKFADTHNMIAFLSKSSESDGFEQIVDFLNAHPIKYALTVNPTIYISCIEQFWSTVVAKTINGEVQLHALVDGNKIVIAKSTVRRDLQLEDEEGVECLSNSAIFEQLTLMGYEKISQKLTFYKSFFSLQWKFLIHTILQCLSAKTTAWNEFSSTMASAIICLATNQKFNFSKFIFEGMIRNLDNVSRKFLMYPRFVQVFLNQQLDGLPTHKRIYNEPSHTKKIFTNIRRVGKGFSGRVTPLFPTMVVQNQSELGEGSAMPTDPHHTPTFITPSPQPQKTQKPRKPRKDTQELGDSLVRAATTASKLEAEQDIGNITKTRSKATPNESSSLGTTSGGGPRCQETIGDTIAQTRFENVSKLSNDSLLARVLDLEKTKTTQQNEIDSLKRRVKKLEKKKSSRTHKLKRLYKVGLTAKVESSGDEEINVQDDADKEMFDVDSLNDEEVFVAGKNENVVEEVVDAAQVSTAATTETITTKELSLAQALEALKTSKPKVKGIVFQEPAQEYKELSDAEKATLFQQLLEKRRKHFAAKRAKEQRNKPPTKAQQRKIMCNYLKNMEGYKLKYLKSKGFDSIQKMFDRAFKRVNTFEDFRIELVEGKEKRAGAELEQEITKKQKVDDDKETAEIKQLMEITLDKEEVTIYIVPLAVKSPSIVDWKTHKEGRKSYYQIIRADGKSQMYMIFGHMLKSFDREDLGTL
ncbi:hypothetical protein Tco_0275873 [Tanacetum coccineum]